MFEMNLQKCIFKKIVFSLLKLLGRFRENRVTGVGGAKSHRLGHRCCASKSLTVRKTHSMFRDMFTYHKVTLRCFVSYITL